MKAPMASRAGNGGAAPSNSTEALLAVRDLSVSFRDDTGWLQTLKDVSLDGTAGRDRRHRRRERLRQVADRAVDPRSAAAARLPAHRRNPVRGPRSRASSANAQMRQRPRPPDRHDLPGADERARSGVHGRRPDRRNRAHAFPVSRASEACERAVEALAAVGIASPRNCAAMYPMSLVGRHAPARDDRDGAGVRAAPPDRRRADHRARRDHPGADHGPAARTRQRTGTAILFITHNLGLVAESCARMLTMYAGQVVEDGPVEEILSRPFHPYTAGLLASLPHVGQRKSRLPSIPGRVPSAHEMPAGCRFEPRCTYVDAAMRTSRRRCAQVGERHVRCRRSDVTARARGSRRRERGNPEGRESGNRVSWPPPRSVGAGGRRCLFAVRKGETFGIIGESGSGKSTRRPLRRLPAAAERRARHCISARTRSRCRRARTAQAPPLVSRSSSRIRMPRSIRA